jgi:tryptophan synthase alpha chain
VSNRIDSRFQSLAAERRTALVPFITTGDPDPAWTVGIMHALVAAGADVLELGVPFSDPMADGPVIQMASERAIERGVSLATVLDTVRAFRRSDSATPVVLMGYLNPIERFGADEFARLAASAGVDGVLIVDCPPEEMGRFRAPLDEQGVHTISLIAPTTTPGRMKMIARQARGYLYYVSFKGITGANRLVAASLEEPIRNIRDCSELPIAVGFGIKGPESAAAVSRVADAVVIGSALIEQIADADSEQTACQRVHSFLAPIRHAMDNGAKIDRSSLIT